MMKTVSRILPLAIIFAFLLAATATADDDIYKMLPRNHEVGSWVKDGPEALFFDFSLGRILDDRVVNVIDDYGFERMLSQYYSLDDDLIEMRIYEMSSSEQVYGLYSVFGDIQPNPEGAEIIIQDPDLKITHSVSREMRVVSDNEIHLLGDNYFIWVFAYQNGHRLDLLLFANKIQSKFDVVGVTLTGTKPLQSDDKIFGTERLIGGYDSLGLYFQVGHFDPFLLDEEDVRCLQADYRLKPGRLYRQLLFEYPDEDMSRVAYDAFTEWVDDYNFLRRLNYADSIGSVVAENESERYIGGFRDGPLLRIFYGFEDLDDVRKMLRSYARKD